MNVLIVKLGATGDVVRTTPLLKRFTGPVTWITAAKRSRIPAFTALGKRLQEHFEAVIAAVELGISNALIEGINAKIRLINARGYGHHSAQTLTSMIYLCLGGLRPQPPTRR